VDSSRSDTSSDGDTRHALGVAAGLLILGLGSWAALVPRETQPSPPPSPISRLVVPASPANSGPANSVPSESPTPTESPLSASTPIALGPSTPIRLGPAREVRLPRPTWGRYVPGDPAYQVEPPSLSLDGPQEPEPAPSPSEAAQLYAKGLELVGRGKDGIEELERAAEGGHLEAAFLSWVWQPNPSTGQRLTRLLDPEARARLLASFAGGLPEALWVPVSPRWASEAAGDQLAEPSSGGLAPDLVVERVGQPRIRSQSLRLEGEGLALRTELTLPVEVEEVFRQGGKQVTRSRAKEVELSLTLSLEPLGDW
jgi:hypothetical protein